MGWTYFKTSFKAIDYLKEAFTHGDWKVIHAEQPNRQEVYMALQNNETKEVHALVCLVDELIRGEIGYKLMDESMEPYYYNASATLLNLLTPTKDENSLRWRKVCMSS